MGNGSEESPIRDVVLFEDSGNRFDPRRTDDPPIFNRVQLAPNVFIERLPAQLNRYVKNACAFRGYNWEIRMDTFPTLYAFVRETKDTAEWDDGQLLQTAVSLSRLCHPTSIGLEFAGK